MNTHENVVSVCAILIMQCPRKMSWLSVVLAAFPFAFLPSLLSVVLSCGAALSSFHCSISIPIPYPLLALTAGPHYYILLPFAVQSYSFFFYPAKYSGVFLSSIPLIVSIRSRRRSVSVVRFLPQS